MAVAKYKELEQLAKARSRDLHGSGFRIPWHKLVWWSYILSAIGFGIIIISILWPVMEKRQRAMQENQRLQREYNDLLARKLALEDELDRLKTDRLYLEMKAREILNKAKPGETIILVPQPDKSDTHH